MSSNIDRYDPLFFFIKSGFLYLLIGVILGFLIAVVVFLFFFFLYSRSRRTDQFSYIQMTGERMDIHEVQALDGVLSPDELDESERILIELIWKKQPVNQSQLPELADMSRSRISELVSVLEKEEWIVRERIGRTYRIRLNTLKLPERI